MVLCPLSCPRLSILEDSDLCMTTGIPCERTWQLTASRSLKTKGYGFTFMDERADRKGSVSTFVATYIATASRSCSAGSRAGTELPNGTIAIPSPFFLPQPPAPNLATAVVKANKTGTQSACALPSSKAIDRPKSSNDFLELCKVGRVKAAPTTFSPDILH
jgi:hypothetical protein